MRYTEHYFKVNGYDLLPYIAEKGLNWSENDVDSPNAGRMLDGYMYRGKVASKKKIEIKLNPLGADKTREILNILDSEYLSVSYIDPKEGATILQMYNSTRPAACLSINEDDEVVWEIEKLSFIER